MAFEQKDNSGSLFKNEKKEKETHPNMRGSAKIDGIEYWVSGWTKEGKNGKWISLSFKPKEETPPQAKKPTSKFDDMASDIPF